MEKPRVLFLYTGNSARSQMAEAFLRKHAGDRFDAYEERCPFFPGAGIRLHWSFEDPAAYPGSAEEKLVKFRQVRDQIDARIRTWLASNGTPAPG